MEIFTVFAKAVFTVFSTFGINIGTIGGADTMVMVIFFVIFGVVVIDVIKTIGKIFDN